MIQSRCLSLLMLGFMFPSGMAGAPPTVTLSVNGAPLSKVLRALSAQSDTVLVFADHLVDAVRVRVALDDMPVDQALDHLLRDSGLAWKQVADKRFVIHPDAQASRLIRGTVVALPDGEGLRGAQLTLDGKIYYLTDAQGYFEIRVPEQALAALRVSAAGFAPMEAAVGARDFVEVRMTPAPHISEHLRVASAGASAFALNEGVGSATITPDAVAAIYGDLGRDLFDQLSLLPGISEGELGDPGLSFRGSAASENMILLDGIKVYQPDHAIGFFSSVNTEALSQIRVFKSGSPARYGGRMAGVVDMSIRAEQTERMGLSAGINRDIADALVTLPLSKNVTWMLSARTSVEDDTSTRVAARVWETTFNEEVWTPDDDEELIATRTLDFTDFTSKLSWRLPDGGNLSFSLYAGRDQSNDGVDWVGDDEPVRINQRKGDWGNTGYGLQWRKQWDRQRIEIDASSSELDTDFSALELFDEEEETFERNTVTDNRLRENSINLRHIYAQNDRTQYEFGLGYSEISNYYREETEISFFFEEEDDAEDIEVEINDEATEQLSFYGQITTRPTDAWEISLGFHVLDDQKSNDTAVDPRLAASYQVHDRLALRASWGRYHQYILRSPDTVNYFEGLITWFLAGDFIQPGQSDHLQVGGKWLGDQWSLDLELYRKDVSGSLNRIYDPLRDFDNQLPQSNDRIDGLDLLFRKTHGPFSAMLAYTYTDARTLSFVIPFDEFDDFNENRLLNFPTNRDIPHNLKMTFGYGNASWRGALIYAYASGRPYDRPVYETFVDDGEILVEPRAPEQLNASRLPNRERVDVSLRHFITAKRGDYEIGLTLRNLFDERNVLYRYFAPNEDDIPAPVDVTDFGFRASLDLRVRY